ncbi:hypothetical protein PsYK624_163030 [Phanerochaete sordida]|uniref:Uncharacterized protein n=1 Tax=Phanerochaete sordida TaxID=48140 RepID=A0A9P3GQP8_9APHY|nr:hypothetical protein PsYK624_163030 [Phanerochaete sordida]
MSSPTSNTTNLIPRPRNVSSCRSASGVSDFTEEERKKFKSHSRIQYKACLNPQELWDDQEKEAVDSLIKNMRSACPFLERFVDSWPVEYVARTWLAARRAKEGKAASRGAKSKRKQALKRGRSDDVVSGPTETNESSENDELDSNAESEDNIPIKRPCRTPRIRRATSNEVPEPTNVAATSPVRESASFAAPARQDKPTESRVATPKRQLAPSTSEASRDKPSNREEDKVDRDLQRVSADRSRRPSPPSVEEAPGSASPRAFVHTFLASILPAPPASDVVERFVACGFLDEAHFRAFATLPPQERDAFLVNDIGVNKLYSRLIQHAANKF